MRALLRNTSGFSLVEILVVITIIGLLMAMSGGAYLIFFKEAESASTQAFITELGMYADGYNDVRGDYPPSRLKYLGLATTGDDANEGVEAFVQALYNKDYTGNRPDNTSEFINMDDDEANKNKTLWSKADLFEFQDAWGNPIIYIRHSDYKKKFTYTLEGETGVESFQVQALRNPKTGEYYKFESYQIISVGPDGEFDTGDDVCNFTRIDPDDE